MDAAGSRYWVRRVRSHADLWKITGDGEHVAGPFSWREALGAIRALVVDPQRPDQFCKSLPDGSCVSDHPLCMHSVED